MSSKPVARRPMASSMAWGHRAARVEEDDEGQRCRSRMAKKKVAASAQRLGGPVPSARGLPALSMPLQVSKAIVEVRNNQLHKSSDAEVRRSKDSKSRKTDRLRPARTRQRPASALAPSSEALGRRIARPASAAGSLASLRQNARSQTYVDGFSVRVEDVPGTPDERYAVQVRALDVGEAFPISPPTQWLCEESP